MHYARPPPQLQPWLDIGRHDLYAISTQEADRHLAVAVVLPAKPRWEAALRRAFGIDGDGDDGASGYTWLGSRALGGSHVALLVRTALVPSITRLRRGGVPAGLLGGLLGNKGGVALELTLGRSTLLFVGVHLAAHTGRAAVEARDSQLLSIFARLPAALSRGGGGGGGEAAGDDEGTAATAAVEAARPPPRAHHHPHAFAGAEAEYYLCVIDLLQEWDVGKRLERWAKVALCCLWRDRQGMSAVEPDHYARRFLRMIDRLIVRGLLAS